MKYPFISCKCITYGRIDLLEEAVQSFLQQDYPESMCELIIVNDYKLQKIKYKNPRIKIYNLDEMFPTIGDKENFATALCRGDIICQWDDDDIALPNHLKNVAKYFEPGTTVLHWMKGAYWNEPAITALVSLGNSGIVYSKKVWESVLGFPRENAGCDMHFVEKMHAAGQYASAAPANENVSWFYRWGFTNKPCYHQSGQGTDDGTRPNILIRHSEFIEGLRRKGLIPTGEIILHPHWNYDYVKQLEEYNTPATNVSS
jgi:glycosyltransferase involved in cell wall biosynthesis